jgi:hypothetical protein
MTGDILFRFSENDKPEIFLQGASDIETELLREWIQNIFMGGQVRQDPWGNPRKISPASTLCGREDERNNSNPF